MNDTIIASVTTVNAEAVNSSITTANSSVTSVKWFVLIMIIVGIMCTIILFISTKPPERIVQKYYPNYDKQYSFFYRKATAYRMLFNTHVFLSNTLKIVNACTTFIVVYCAMIDETYLLLFSMLSALSSVVMLTIPFEIYAKVYVDAARKLENAIQAENISQQLLLNAYNEAEKIIQEKFM